jgi:Rrf2 family protein
MPAATNTQFAVAVHVLTYLAAVGDERPVSSDELSASTNTNPVYVRRVLGPLRDAGLVSARQGSHGGWALGRAATDIGLAEVWSVLQGDDAVLGLHGPNPQCPIGAAIQRSLHDLDAQVRDALRAELGRRTVADLLGAINRPARTSPGPGRAAGA